MRSSPLTKGGTQPPALGANSLNHKTTRKIPVNELFNQGLLLILFVAHLCSFTYVPRCCCYCCCCCWVASVVSDSVWPHRRQPTRLPRPWESPGKNPGVGCHFLLQCMKVKSESKAAQLCLTCSDPLDCNLRGSSVHGIFQARVLEWVAIAFSIYWYYEFSNHYKSVGIYYSEWILTFAELLIMFLLFWYVAWLIFMCFRNSNTSFAYEIKWLFKKMKYIVQYNYVIRCDNRNTTFLIHINNNTLSIGEPDIL